MLSKTILSITLFIYFNVNLFSQIYVAPDGNDFNPGNEKNPVKTIGVALKLLKEQKNTMH